MIFENMYTNIKHQVNGKVAMSQINKTNAKKVNASS